MMFELRAAQAARSVRVSVSGVKPAPIPAIVGRHRRALVVNFATAAAAVLLIMGIATAMPRLFEPNQAANNPSTPPDGTPLVIEPDDKPNEGELVELETPETAVAVRQTNSTSDSSQPYTVFYGTAEVGSTVSALSEYGEASAVVFGEGGFELKLRFDPLPPAGEAFPIVLIVDGVEYQFSFTSLFDPTAVAATAHQTYGASGDAAAYEKLFGTAPAGSVVVATSPYGSADTVADENGHWYLKLWFDGPLPLDEPFDITVTIGDETFSFGFVSLFEIPAPELSISQVNSSSESSSPYVQFVGTAPAGTHLLAQSSYGGHDIVVGESGEFSLKLWFTSLPPAGVQFPVTFKVNHEFYATFYFTSYFEKATGGTESVAVDQYNTSSDSADPWIKFHVYGPGGTQVQIVSPYGSITQTIQKSGDYLRLYFSSLPPAGQQFNVTVKINGETFGTYPFTSYFDPENVAVGVDQHNTESWDANPWVKFAVTGPVGTQVQIVSPYGSTTRTMESTSEYVKLFLSSVPPAGVEFQVTVKIDGAVHGTYPFTSHWDPNQIIATPVYTENSEPFTKIEYYGPAGTSFQLTSDHGNSDQITLGSSGSGHLKLQFASTPPAGTAITITVMVNGSTHSTYGFTYTSG